MRHLACVTSMTWIASLQTMAEPSSLLNCGFWLKPSALKKAVEAPRSVTGRLMKRDLVMLGSVCGAAVLLGAGLLGQNIHHAAPALRMLPH